MHGVDLVRRFPSLVLGVQQTSVLWVAQQEVCDTLAATSHRHVQWVITTLTQTNNKSTR